MTPLRWDRIKQIVGDALDLQREARPAFIERACGEDADLRLNVDTLLRADQPGSPFLNLDREPERLGPWRVVREIGRGGMGTVYLAERDDGQFEQRAANDTGLKLELAEGYLRVGIVQGLAFESNLGKLQEAGASFEKAIARFESVVRARPNDLQAATGLGRALLGLTTTYRDPGRAMAANQRVAAMMENFAREKPLDTAAQVLLGQAYFGMAERLMDGQHNTEALAARVKCIEYFRDLTTRHPENDDAQRFLAQSEKRLAYFYITRIRDFPKAGGHLAISLNIDRQRLARQPANVAVKLDLELDYAYLAGLFRREGDLPAALRYQQSATAARTEVLAADPRNFRVRDLSIADRARLGALFRDMKRPAEARAAFEQGFQLAHEGDPVAMSTPDAESAIADLRMESTAPPAPKGGMAQRTR